jgi:chromosome segregation ATPase
MSDGPLMIALHQLTEQVREQGDRLDGKIERLRTDLDRLRVDVMARMDRLQNGITSIRDDITVTTSMANRVHDANEHTREEVRALGDVVSAMQKQISRLQSQVRELRGEP